MSERAAGTAEFTDLWRSISKTLDSKIHGQGRETQMPGATTSTTCTDLQSPKGRHCRRFSCLNNGDSPGDVEPSQDIFWDSTSPTPANTGFRNTRVVEISDIVNRIAPVDVKRKGTESPLLQWIGDSDTLCTPDLPKPRVRKKSSRQTSVDDLVKLARQFDENMQQDKATSEQLNAVNNNLSECGNTSRSELKETSFPANTKDPKLSSSTDQVEAELHALFDGSTQKVSGRLSQGSSASACSQDAKDQRVAEPRLLELKSGDKSGPAAQTAVEKRSSANNCDDFDDDWENDDLLNDSFVLAMTQNADHDTNPRTTAQTNTPQSTSVCKPTASTYSSHRPSGLHSKPSSSALQELCPKPKTTNRSTFKLDPNPHFQPKAAAKASKSSFTAIQAKPPMSEQKAATTKTPTSQYDKISHDQKESCAAPDVAKDISDGLWDDWADGDDDELLYQVCDSVERISNSQPQHKSPSNDQEKQDGQRKTTAPLPIDAPRSTKAGAKANGQSARAFVHSYSLPGTSCKDVNYQGWNVPMKGASSKSRLSQSLPGSHMSPGALNQWRDSSGTFQPGNANEDTKPLTVTAVAPQKSKSYHTAFKRNVSDSAVISNKVFVTSQMTGMCSSAQIEKKKQEALARRRLRMQNAPKP